MTKTLQPSARLRVKVVPGSSRDEIVGRPGDAVKIKVTAPPEKGKANEAVVEPSFSELGRVAWDRRVSRDYPARCSETHLSNAL